MQRDSLMHHEGLEDWNYKHDYVEWTERMQNEAANNDHILNVDGLSIQSQTVYIFSYSYWLNVHFNAK